MREGKFHCLQVHTEKDSYTTSYAVFYYDLHLLFYNGGILYYLSNILEECALKHGAGFVGTFTGQLRLGPCWV